MAAENLSGNFGRENESAVSRQNKAEQCQTVADIREYKSEVQIKWSNEEARGCIFLIALILNVLSILFILSHNPLQAATQETKLILVQIVCLYCTYTHTHFVKCYCNYQCFE